MLEQHSGHTANKLSELQAVAISQAIATAGTSLSSDNKVELATLTATVQWSTDRDRDIVLSSLQPDAPPTKRGRCVQQDFKNIHNYLTQQQWAGMLDAEVPSDVKLTSLLSHAMHLGMRAPTEPSMKWIVSIATVCSTDPVSLQRMDEFTKAIKYKTAKQQVDGMRRKAVAPAEWVDVLPDQPVAFLRTNGVMFRAAFGDLLPVSPCVSPDVIGGFDMTYGCRGGLKKVPHFGSPRRSARAPELIAAPPAEAAMAGFKEFAITIMNAMQNQQTTMLQMLAPGAPGASGAHGSQQKALSFLADRPRHAMQALPGFEARIEELPETPPPKTLALPPSSPGATSSSQPRAIAAPPTPIQDMLNMIKAKKTESAAKKAKTKVREDEAVVSEEAEEAAEDEVAAGDDDEGKSEAAAAGKKSTDAACGKKTKGAEGKHKVSAKAKSKPSPASAKAAKGEVGSGGKVAAKDKGGKGTKGSDDARLIAKERFNAGGSSKWKPPMGFGCSKCRWTKMGCAVCKNLGFQGSAGTWTCEATASCYLFVPHALHESDTRRPLHDMLSPLPKPKH